jgi:PPOX class probable F420-dependent enzyme
VNLGELIQFVRAQGDGVVSTIGADGSPQAAYLAVAVTDLGELVFDARPSSRKVANILRDPRAALTIGGRDGATVQFQGTADLPTGQELERCIAAYLDAFPQFAESIAKDVVVVRVRIEWARYGQYEGSDFMQTDVDLAG